jgi:hypothetical protein
MLPNLFPPDGVEMRGSRADQGQLSSLYDAVVVGPTIRVNMLPYLFPPDGAEMRGSRADQSQLSSLHNAVVVGAQQRQFSN